jgi:hypothetical protein
MPGCAGFFLVEAMGASLPSETLPAHQNRLAGPPVRLFANEARYIGLLPTLRATVHALVILSP